MVLTSPDAVVPVEPANVPAALKEMERWCVWKAEPDENGTYTKKPMHASWPSRGLSKTTPSQWRSFGTAMQAYRSREELGGIGFITGGGIVAVDLDEVADEVTRELTPQAAELVERLNTYAEYSVSGRGVRLFLRGTLPGKNVNSKAAGYELYGEGGYVTVTGARVPGTPDEIAEGGELLAELYAAAKEAAERAKQERKAARDEKRKAAAGNGRVGGPEKAVQASGRHRTPAARPGLSDEELVELATSAANGDAVRELLEGRTAGYGSPSEAELALANHLAFYAGPGGEAQVESIIRGSKLKRDKMDAPRGDTTHLGQTVAKAYEGRGEFYTPAAKRNGAAIGAPGRRGHCWPGDAHRQLHDDGRGPRPSPRAQGQRHPAVRAGAGAVADVEREAVGSG